MRTFILSIFSLLFIVVSSPVSALEAEIERANEMSRVWKENPIYESGVYERADYLFSVVCLKNPNKSQSRSRAIASLRSSQQLYRYALEHFYVLSDQRDVNLLKFVPGQLKVSGHVIFGSKINDIYVYVFATQKQELEASVGKVQFNKLIKGELNLLIKNPKNYLKFFNDSKLDQLKLLAEAEAERSSITRIIEPYATVADGIDYYKKNEASYPLVTTENQSFCPISDFKTPILKAVCKAGGVVIFDSKLSDKRPEVMDEILKRFQTGKELTLAIYLLETAAERTPRNAQVWEYLEAAYRANKEDSKARMAANVWYLLDPQKRAESIKKVLQYENTTQSKDFLTYLSDKGL